MEEPVVEAVVVGGQIAWIQVITAVTTLLVAAAGFLVSLAKIREVHVATNSKMDLLIAEVRKASFAAGQKAEKERTEVSAEVR